MSNREHLGGRRAPAPTPSSSRPGRRSELGADPLAAEYDRGPFPGAHVPAFPSHLVTLVERATGRPFDPVAYAAYERIRAFTGYPGVELPPELGSRRALVDTRRDPPPPTPAGVDRRSPLAPSSPRPIAAALPGSINPQDLGD
jgi:hypothetical protein